MCMVEVCISVPDSDLKMIDAYCKFHGFKRSTYLVAVAKRHISSDNFDFNAASMVRKIWEKFNDR